MENNSNCENNNSGVNQNSSKEFLWKELQTDIDLYKFYFDLLIKSSTFFFAITGGISAYFLKNNGSTLRYSLLLPILMNLGFVIVSFWSSGKVKLMIRDFEATCDKIGFDEPYDMHPLLYLIWILFTVHFLIFSCLIVLMIFPELVFTIDSK